MTERERFERYKAAERGIEYERFKLIRDIHEETYGVRYHQLTQIVSDWKLWQAATAQAVPEGYVVVPVEPTHTMIKRAAESVCREWEGTPTSLLEFLDFSGENMACLVIAEALRQAVKAA